MRLKLALLVAVLAAGAAHAASLTVLGPASIVPGAKVLAAQFTVKTGIAVSVEGGSRQKVLAALASGSGDVVLLPASDFAGLAGVSAPTPLVAVPVGVAVKPGAPVPDISTPQAFAAALTASHGVAYADPSAGTSAGRLIDAMLNQPAYARVHRVPVKGLAVSGLASGQADMALQLLPELANNPAVQLAGPVPTGLAVDFAAATATASPNSADARTFVAFIAGPDAAAAWRAQSLRPAH
jgi:molybdate transport system substrate-binding protein